MQISSKLWSDFGAHIPLIRSFSRGANLWRLTSGQSIESPLFPGEPIRYHFGFYALAGILERLGLRVDWAINLPSALGFALLLLGIWVASFRIFRSSAISALSVLFFLCNGSLSFLRFFTNNPLSTHTIADIVSNNRFSSFGPWDKGDISAFWTLNIYTNQRHLALSYALVLIMIILFVNIDAEHTSKKRVIKILLGAMCLSMLLFINYAAFSIAALFLLWFFLCIPKYRVHILLAGLLTLPAFFMMRHGANLPSQIAVEPGYLIRTGLTISTIASYWWQNIGLHSLLIPTGILLAPRVIRRTVAAPLVLLFILPQLFRFSPDMINNHKFFNFFMIIGSMFSALVITKIFSIRRIGVAAASLMVGFMILSGVIDFFPVINDNKGAVIDSNANPDVRFFSEHVAPDAVVANTTWFYHPASLAGRSLLSGYTYFTWSYGYDQVKREQILIDIYTAQTDQQACALLKQHNVSYVEISQRPEDYLIPNYAVWDQLTPDYSNIKNGLRVYSQQTICSLHLSHNKNPL